MGVRLDVYFFFQAEDGIRDLVRSRGLGDVYKRQDDITLGDAVSEKWYFEIWHSSFSRSVFLSSLSFLSLIHI